MVTQVGPGDATQEAGDLRDDLPDAPIAAPADEATARAIRISELRAALASEAAFSQFYARALPRVYGYLLHRCRGDVALAEDLTQAAFGELVRRPGAFDGRSDAVTWLTGIARHKLVDHFRAREREERGRMHLVVHELAMDREAEPWRSSDERELLVANLGRLAPMQQAALILHYADGLPVREIARELGRSESSVESLLSRGRDALRAAYRESGDD